ncbi:MAG: amidoligase family protein [Alphaproteobacteria bacterium]|nr:amidoligase family protein [Alphaproteobacteria bacterium]
MTITLYTNTPIAPPSPTTDGTTERRVGVEIEFAALKPQKAAQLVADHFGGTVVEVDAHRYEIRDGSEEVFLVELDAHYAHPNDKLHDVGERKPWLSDMANWLRDLDVEASRLIGDLGGDLIPCEVVCPPIPWSRLNLVEDFYRALHQAGAAGTDEGLLYAFGLHMNIEVTGESTDDILPTLKAYLLLSSWLRSSIQVDGTRRIFPYIDPFPSGYVKRVCAPDYNPDINGMIGDYLSFNPTRNRELDMLPLFSHLRAARVSRAVDDPRIKARPAYHWRLPNALFSGQQAGPLAEWFRWLTVERLAADQEGLDSACEAFQNLSPLPLTDDLELFSCHLAEAYRP